MSETKEKVSEKKQASKNVIKDLFNKLNSINCNEYVEEKGPKKLKYLSWSPAVKILTEAVDDWSYEIYPYEYDEKLGYMVHTSITIDGVTKKMWLPVMDGNNKAMKDHKYKYITQYGEKIVEAATMFDINTAQMRCLVKNMAMFGFGLYIYAGEDLPDGNTDVVVDEEAVVASVPSLQDALKHSFVASGKNFTGLTIETLVNDTKNNKVNLENVAKAHNADSPFCEVVLKAIENGELSPNWKEETKA